MWVSTFGSSFFFYPFQFRQLIFNLVSNALKFAKDIKFTDLLRPYDNKEVYVYISVSEEEGKLIAKSSITNKEKTFLKAKLEYIYCE